MVTKYYFRLIIYFLFFILSNNILIGEDKMKKIEINVESAAKKYEVKQIKIIDVRTLKEWKMTGIIPGSILINMHNEDFSENTDFLIKVENIIKANIDMDIAFICASGARSELVANYFIEKKYHNIYHIPEGILGTEKNGWLYKGFPVEDYN